MRIYKIIWKDQFVDKLESKHQISTQEVEEVLLASPRIRRVQKGQVKGEDLYAAYGQTEAGRYVIIFFVHKGPAGALPISARDMDAAERRLYEKKKKGS